MNITAKVLAIILRQIVSDSCLLAIDFHFLKLISKTYKDRHKAQTVR